MAMETTALLRTILYQVMEADDKDDAIRAVRVMCTKDDIAAVEKEIADKKAKRIKPTQGDM